MHCECEDTTMANALRFCFNLTLKILYDLLNDHEAQTDPSIIKLSSSM